MNNIDQSNFKQFIIDTPNQFKVGIELAKNIKLNGDFKSLTVSGMGGSALPADLLTTYCNDLFENSSTSPFDIYVNRTYSIQKLYRENSLHFVASYSGNTEETLSSLEELHSMNISFVGFSSGGKLEEKCKEYNMPFVKLPIPYPNYQPRMGTGYFVSAMIQVLINQGLIPDLSEDILNSTELFKSKMSQLENKGKEISAKLKGKTPIIYASSKFRSVAMVWKIKINENAKTPAFWNYFPELNHNEMVGFTNPQAKFFLIMLRDGQDNPKNLKRYEATAKLLEESGLESEIINMDGNSTFLKMFLSISLSDWVSYYLALEYGQDPTPVEMVENLKKIIAS